MNEVREPQTPSPALYVAALGEEARKRAFPWVTALRKSGYWVEMDYAGRSLKSQMKRADRLGARLVLMVGENELASGKGLLRDMAEKTQEDIPLEEVIAHMEQRLEKEASPGEGKRS
jgi:histidyl-tRNA synthetase